MKIYFAGSIRGGRDDKDLYAQIISELQKYGNVLTEHIGDPNLKETGEEFSEDYIYKRDMDWLRSCDLVIAEVTTPSLGVGYEIGQAESMGKKIVCLYREVPGKSLSAMLSGNSNFQIHKYQTLDDLRVFFVGFFKSL